MEGDLPLAVEAHARFQPGRVVTVTAGDRMLFYTDGAYEVTAAGSASDRLGIERFAQLVQESSGGPSPDFLRRILSRIEAFAGEGLDDDVALLEVMRR